MTNCQIWDKASACTSYRMNCVMITVLCCSVLWYVVLSLTDVVILVAHVELIAEREGAVALKLL